MTPLHWDDLTNEQQLLIRKHVAEKLHAIDLSVDDLKVLEGENIVDLINDKHPQIFNSTIPSKKISYSIPRKILFRHVISRKIFQHNGPDVFVFTGLTIHELWKLSGKEKVYSSKHEIEREKLILEVLDNPITNKSVILKRPTIQFMLLDFKSDFEEVCRIIGTKPVHWLHFYNSSLLWVKTKGNMKTMRKYVDNSREALTEETFIEMMELKRNIGNSISPVFIFGAPKMGKSELLSEIARKLQFKFPDRTILVITASDLYLDQQGEVCHKLKSADEIAEALSSRISKTEFGKKVFFNYIQSKKLIIELLVDGIDELRLDYQEVTIQNLKQLLATFQSIRLWITCTESIVYAENKLKTLSHKLQPFDSQDQVELLTKYWMTSNETKFLDKVNLAKIANQCVEKLHSFKADCNKLKIEGTPFQTLLLAEVYENHAGESCMELPEIDSITELYRFYTEKKLQSCKTLNMETKQAVINKHVHLAMSYLFSNETAEFHHELKMPDRVELAEFGLLKARDHDGAFEDFIHPTVADFFVASYLFEKLKTGSTSQVVNFIMKEVLSQGKQIKFLMETYEKEYKIRVSRFKHLGLCYFFNALIQSFVSTDLLVPNIELKLTSSHHKSLVKSSVYDDLENLLVLFEQITEISDTQFDNVPWIYNQEYQHLCVHRSSFACLNYIINKVKRNLSPSSFRLNKHVLYSAVEMGKLCIVEYLVNSSDFHEYLRWGGIHVGILNTCVWNTASKPAEEIMERMQILRFLVDLNYEIIVDWANVETGHELPLPVIVCPKIHFDLIIKLIHLGANVQAEDEYGCTILHTAAYHLSEEKYYLLLKTILTKTSDITLKYLLKVKDITGWTPLHRLVERVNPSEKILDIFREYGANFNSIRGNGETVLATAIKRGRNNTCLKEIINRGAKVKWFDKEHGNLLHVAVQSGRIDAIRMLAKMVNVNSKNGEGKSSLHLAVINEDIQAMKILIDNKINVNLTDDNDNTALHQVMLNGSNYYRVEMANLLIENGANFNAVNNNRHTPLYSALCENPQRLNARVIKYFEESGWLNTSELATLGCRSTIMVLHGIDNGSFTQSFVDDGMRHHLTHQICKYDWGRRIAKRMGDRKDDLKWKLINDKFEYQEFREKDTVEPDGLVETRELAVEGQDYENTGAAKEKGFNGVLFSSPKTEDGFSTQHKIESQDNHTLLKQLGRIKYDINVVLGEGRCETRVFRGNLDGRDVAVKRLNRMWADLEQVKREVELTRMSDSHENVIKYYEAGGTEDYILIAMELCSCSLFDWIKSEGACIQPLSISHVEILHQTTKGVEHLHNLRIVHRDLKLENVLLFVMLPNLVRVRISDFGISKKLPDGKTRATTTKASGSEGWMAPEILEGIENPEEKKRFSILSDIFSLGCIFYSVLTNGAHPFGNSQITRQYHILQGTHVITKEKLTWKYSGSVPLIISMISREPTKRPPAKAILSHHLFWSKKTKLQFLVDVSNCFDKKNEATNSCAEKVESIYSSAIGITFDEKTNPDGWKSKTCQEVQNLFNPETRSKRWKYKGDSVMDLVRVIRNMQNHYIDLAESIQKAVGCLPDEFIEYWISRFPDLLDTVWCSFQPLKTNTSYGLKQYYCEDYDFYETTLECKNESV